DERAQAEAEGFLAPRLQGDGFFASDCELERRVPHACNGDEVPLAVDGIDDSLDLRNRRGNELREFLPDGTRRRRVAYQQRPVLAQQMDRAARAARFARTSLTRSGAIVSPPW